MFYPESTRYEYGFYAIRPGSTSREMLLDIECQDDQHARMIQYSLRQKGFSDIQAVKYDMFDVTAKPITVAA